MGSTLLVVGLVLSVGGCSDRKPRQYAPRDAARAPLLVEEVFETALHRAHEQASVPTSCTDCHRIGDEPTRSSYSGMCITCHDETALPVHTEVDLAPGRECLLCHDFLGEQQEAATCAGCHTRAQAAGGQRIYPNARQVAPHAEETCSDCHQTHGETPLSVRPCLECHDQISLVHQEVPLPDPELCHECHQVHEPASEARARCVGCHEGSPMAHATFAGHDECLSCHRPHPQGSGMSGVRACAGCHDQAAKTFGNHHDRCRSCHSPHRVADSPRGACARCHGDVENDHPSARGQGPCLGCHTIHDAPDEGPPQASPGCVTCHDTAQGPTAWHAGGSACVDCHRPHQFEMDGDDPAVCGRCHQGTGTGTVRVQGRSVGLARGHERCAECHQDAAHRPQLAPQSCRSCHAAEARTAPRGHRECADCHTPHDGVVQKTCAQCHAENLGGFHADPAADCGQCHRPHGPSGPSQPRTCRSCHDGTLPGLHVDEAHSRCADCHQFHGEAPNRTRRTCVGSCHQDLIEHEPMANSCVGCHLFEEGQ